MKGLLILLIWTLIGIYSIPANHSMNKSKDPVTFKVSRDTAYVNFTGRLSSALLINNKYYCFFEEKDPTSSLHIKRFYIISKKGKLEREIELPDEIKKEGYYNLHYRNGRIIVTTYSYKNTLYLDLIENKFTKIPNQDNFIFEDESYRVTASCNGEFGSTIYFEKKGSGTIYEANSGCPVIINKIQGKYFVTSNHMAESILEIDDPSKLEVLDTKAMNSTHNSSLGTINIFEQSYLDNFLIATSFVSNGVLYHLGINHDSKGMFDLLSKNPKTYTKAIKNKIQIGIIKNSEFKPVFNLGGGLAIEFQEQFSLNYQFCTFHTENHFEVGYGPEIPPYKESKYGFIEIMGNQIKMHYFISKKAR